MTVYSRGRLGLRYEGFLTGLRPDPPKTFLKEGFWISKNFCQKEIWQKVGFSLRISVLPKKATALRAAALSVVFPEKSEQTSDEKPELSERSDKVAFHLFRGRADSLSACGNHDKVSCSETALRQDAAISRPHYSLTAVSRYGVAELCRCREADAVEVLLLRVLFFQLRRLVVTQDINRYGFTGEPHSLGICLDKKVVFFYRKLFHKNNPSPGHDNRLPQKRARQTVSG